MDVLQGGIGFFDSGIGGLTVLSACRKRIGGAFYYYGDNANAPYGNLPKERIKEYVLKAFQVFDRLKVRAAVLACNTATAICAEEVRKKYSFPIIGAEPAIRPAAIKGGEVFVLTTRATYKSERFSSLCKQISLRYPNSRLKPFPCDLLAGVIERHLADRGFDYTPYLPKGRPASVVLGCTHYIYIKEIVERFYGCKVYDGNEGIANRLSSFFEEGFIHKANEIFFLGSGKNANRTLYERMFAEKSY